MTPKEQAKELVDKFTAIEDGEMYIGKAKQCASIIVDENVKMLTQILNESPQVFQSINTPKKLCIDLLNPLLKYWQEVKLELQKI